MGDMKKLTQHELQEILNKIYKKGYQSGDLNALELIDDLKENLLLTVSIKNEHESEGVTSDETGD